MVKNPCRNLFLKNHWSHFKETKWYVALVTRVFQCIYINHDPMMTLTYLTPRSTKVAYIVHLNGENCLDVIAREELAGNGQLDKILMILKKKMDPS